MCLPPNGRYAAPPADHVRAMVRCLEAGRCAICGRAFAPPEAQTARAVYVAGRGLCGDCASVAGDLAGPRHWLWWRPDAADAIRTTLESATRIREC
jgi:hypothetical protein